MPYRLQKYLQDCPKHPYKKCARYCELCGIPVCKQCASSSEHKGHHFVNPKIFLRGESQELDKLYYKYRTYANKIQFQKAELNTNSQKLTRAITEHGQALHTEIDTRIEKLKADLNNMDSKFLAMLQKKEEEITCTISEITHTIDYIDKCLKSNDISLVFAYKSRNDEFKTLPDKITVSLPSFTYQKINKEQFYQQLGSLSELTIKTEERVCTMDSPDTEFSLLDGSRGAVSRFDASDENSRPDKPLTGYSKIIASINTKNILHSVSL